tara:strand:+ start:372 stop:695 length:324 start_codon:yes stop_codon:yes gene_type:complete
MKSTYFRFFIEIETSDSNHYQKKFCTSLMVLPHHVQNNQMFYHIAKTIDTVANTAEIWLQDQVRLVIDVEIDGKLQKEWIKIGNPNLIHFSTFFEERIKKELARLKD